MCFQVNRQEKISRIESLQFDPQNERKEENAVSIFSYAAFCPPILQNPFISFHFRATVRPATEPIEEKSTENKITTPAPLNEESLQLHSIISDISVISDPRLLIPAKTNLKQVKVETSEKATNLGLTNSLENLNMPVTNVDSGQQHQQAANLLTT